MPFSLRFSSYPFRFQRSFSYLHSSRRKPSHFILCVRWVRQNRVAGSQFNSISTSSSLLPGLEDALMGYISGSKKATEVAHSVWQHVVQKGDTVIDATCGNGHDTLAMIKMVADESGRGHVYGMDIQRAALENTSSFLDAVLDPVEKDHVKLFSVCHSRMEDIVPKDIPVRLVAFNLGYLPGGDKTITTAPETTLLAFQAASRILGPGGLISIVVYVGHPGGSKEFETVQDFASALSVDNWVCCKFEMINRPVAPILVFLFRR